MNAEYWIWLGAIPEVTNKIFASLLEQFGDPKEVFAAAKRDPGAIGFVGPKAAHAIRTHADLKSLDAAVDALKRFNIRAILYGSPEYPIAVQNVYSPPPILYVRGADISIHFEHSIAMVGSRNCSEYGRRCAFSIARDLAEHEITVVSGLAYGIDSESHKGALSTQANIPTVCVLANGLDVPYPRAHAKLFAQILERGAAVSEYPPGYPAMSSNFPMRNRIISALSHGVLVVEAPFQSGTKYTVDAALDLGLDVFAVPGNIDENLSQYPLELIKLGAKLVTSAQDIIDVFPKWSKNISAKKHALLNSLAKKAATPANLSDEQAMIVVALSKNDLTTDDLIEITNVPVRKLLIALTDLMNQNIIVKQISGHFTLL